MYTTPLRPGIVVKELIKAFVQPFREARAFPTWKACEDSLQYMKAFRGYSKRLLAEWSANGGLQMRGCPLCSACEAVQFMRTPDGVAYVRCKQCGFVFMNPAPTQSSYDKMYITSYDGLWEEWEKKKKENNLSDDLIEDYFGLEVIRRYVRGGRFFDFGCGTGWVLRLASTFYDVTGLDIDRYKLERIRRELPAVTVIEADIRKGLPESLSERYDVVHSNQNIEHMLQPRVCVKEWRRVLKQDGVLFIACPNVESYAFDVYGGQNGQAVLSHVSLFSLDTLRYLLESEGFDVLESGSYARDVRAYEYWQYRMNPDPALFEHNNMYYEAPKALTLLGYPLWCATELYFFYQMLRRKGSFGNYIFCLGKKRSGWTYRDER